MKKIEARKQVNIYMRGVLKGTVPANRYIRLAVERHKRDLKSASARGLWFDEKAAFRVIEFFHRFLRHSKGEWAGQPFYLEPWQLFIIWVLFGWMRADGTRRFRIAYVEVPRKNGKSTMGAGIGNYLTFADNEPGAEVYSAATKRDQAKIVHTEAIRMVRSSVELSGFAKITRDNIAVLETYSKYEPLGADSDTMDGLNPHGIIIDELHAHRNREVFDVLDSATAARRQPLLFAITMAGASKEGICGEQHELSARILEGTAEDDTHFAFIAAIDADDDWTDPEAWKKANPNYGISVKPDYLKDKLKRALETTAYQNTFLRNHCGRWVKQVTRYIPMDAWDKCGKTPVLEADLMGQSCYSGLDLASKIDIAALVHAFPDDDGGMDILCRFWVPEEGMAERVRRDRVPYDVWAREGWVETTPGNVIDYRAIYAALDADAQRFDIEELAFDRWGATQLIQELEDRGMTVIQFGQGYAMISDPTKELLRLVLSGKIRHGGNPVLRWMADNLLVRTDPAGNVKPDREKSTEKIDGIVALIMALDRAVRHGLAGSVYDERGLLWIGEDDEDDYFGDE